MAILFGGMMMRVVCQNCRQMEEYIQDIVLSRNLTIVETATLMSGGRRRMTIIDIAIISQQHARLPCGILPHPMGKSLHAIDDGIQRSQKATTPRLQNIALEQSIQGRHHHGAQRCGEDEGCGGDGCLDSTMPVPK